MSISKTVTAKIAKRFDQADKALEQNYREIESLIKQGEKELVRIEKEMATVKKPALKGDFEAKTNYAPLLMAKEDVVRGLDYLKALKEQIDEEKKNEQ